MGDKIYNVEHFDENMAKLREMYNDHPKSVSNGVAKLVKELKGQNDGIKDIDKGMLSKVIFSIVIVLIGLIRLASLQYGDAFFLYFAGSIFFLAGFFIGAYVKGMGIVFLFSHGMTGLGLMLSSCFGTLEGNIDPILSDMPSNLMTYFTIAAALLVIATLVTIIHNLSDNFKNNKMNIIYIMAMYVVGIAMFLFYPLAI